MLTTPGMPLGHVARGWLLMILSFSAATMAHARHPSISFYPRKYEKVTASDWAQIRRGLDKVLASPDLATVRRSEAIWWLTRVGDVDWPDAKKPEVCTYLATVVDRFLAGQVPWYERERSALERPGDPAASFPLRAFRSLSRLDAGQALALAQKHWSMLEDRRDESRFVAVRRSFLTSLGSHYSRPQVVEWARSLEVPAGSAERRVIDAIKLKYFLHNAKSEKAAWDELARRDLVDSLEDAIHAIPAWNRRMRAFIAVFKQPDPEIPFQLARDQHAPGRRYTLLWASCWLLNHRSSQGIGSALGNDVVAAVEAFRGRHADGIARVQTQTGRLDYLAEAVEALKKHLRDAKGPAAKTRRAKDQLIKPEDASTQNVAGGRVDARVMPRDGEDDSAPESLLPPDTRRRDAEPEHAHSSSEDEMASVQRGPPPSQGMSRLCLFLLCSAAVLATFFSLFAAFHKLGGRSAVLICVGAASIGFLAALAFGRGFDAASQGAAPGPTGIDQSSEGSEGRPAAPVAALAPETETPIRAAGQQVAGGSRLRAPSDGLVAERVALLEADPLGKEGQAVAQALGDLTLGKNAYDALSEDLRRQVDNAVGVILGGTAAKTGQERMAAKHQLERLWRLAADRLVENLDNPNMTVAEAAAKTLILMRNERIARAVIEKVRSADNERTKALGVFALGKMVEQRKTIVKNRECLSPKESAGIAREVIIPFLEGQAETEVSERVKRVIDRSLGELREAVKKVQVDTSTATGSSQAQ